MQAVGRHLSKCFIAGIVALLPVTGTVISVIYLENTLSQIGLAQQPWYLPGMGIIAVAIVVYALGLTVSTFIGKWFWGLVDRLLDRLPALGMLYRTLKQVLGYGEGKDGLFREVVLVPSGLCHGRAATAGAMHEVERMPGDAVEIGLVTSDIIDPDGRRKLIVFVPTAPMPSAGRLIMIDESHVQHINMAVSDSMKAIVSIGKTQMNLAPRD